MQPIVPYGEGVSPQVIRDDEELERLAGMQLRDSLVRGLGVSNQLHASLRIGSGHVARSISYTDMPTHHAPPKPTLFTSRFQHQAPGEGGSYASLSLKQQLTPADEERTIGQAKDTPIHSFTGPVSTVKIDTECSSVHNPQHNHWPHPKPCVHHRYHARRHAHNSTTIPSKPSFTPNSRY